MNVFILTDLEGIAGVCDIEYMDRSGEKYRIARKLLCESINDATEACIQSGADKVYYLDGHGGGGNVIDELVDSRAEKCDFDRWEELIRSGAVDCQIELGAHARAGTIGGFLDHTMNSRMWFCHTVNGRIMSELSMHAVFCSKFGVPIVAAIGDKVGCEQAKEYVPDIFVGQVKVAEKRNFCVTYPNHREILIETVKTALKNYRSVSLFTIPEPLDVRLTLYRTDMCEDILEKNLEYGIKRADARTVYREIDELTSFRQLTF